MRTICDFLQIHVPIYQCSRLIYAFAISSKARDMGNKQTHVVPLRCHFVLVLIVAQQHSV
jgi:hypothetical protein